MAITDRLSRSLVLHIVKKLLDVGIAIYLILIPLIIIQGGFKINFLGFAIKATHLYTPIKILMPLLFIRMLITFRIKNILLMIASIFITLLAAEVVLRLWNPAIAQPAMRQIHKASSVYGWEHVPGSFGIGSVGESYRINSAGFRDKEHTLREKPGSNRIMVIGDSFTFGVRVNLEDTYPKQLEKLLNRRTIACEVINCGVIGHNMWQHYEMLRNKVLPYDPDLVVLGLFQDDLACSVRPYDEPEGYQGHNPFEDRGASGILSRVSLWNFLRNANALFEYKYRYRRGYNYMRSIEDRRKKWGPANPTDLNYMIMSGKIKKTRYIEFSKALKQFAITADKEGARVLVVLIPDSVQLNDPHMQAVNRFVEQVCVELKIPFIDVTPILEAQEDHISLYLFPFDAHNSPKGLQLIAKSIADQIIKLDLLAS